MDGKVTVVVGSSSVLDGNMAVALGKAGERVALLYYSNKAGAEEHRQAIEKAGVVAITLQADSADKDNLQSIRVDILLNAPGVNSTTPVLEIDEEEWYHIQDVNLKGVFLFCQVFGEQMITEGEGGSIINISSASSETPLSIVFTYSISKSGMNSMTKFLAR